MFPKSYIRISDSNTEYINLLLIYSSELIKRKLKLEDYF